MTRWHSTTSGFSRATSRIFSVSLLPATAAVIGVAVLRQIPTATEAAAVALVVAGIGIHRQAA